jgi:hypothetical protein
MLYPPLILTLTRVGEKVRINPPAVSAYYADTDATDGLVMTRVCVGNAVFTVMETPAEIAAMLAELCRLQDQTVFNIPGVGLEELRALRSVGRIEVVERPEGDKPDHGF